MSEPVGGPEAVAGEPGGHDALVVSLWVSFDCGYMSAIQGHHAKFWGDR